MSLKVTYTAEFTGMRRIDRIGQSQSARSGCAASGRLSEIAAHNRTS